MKKRYKKKMDIMKREEFDKIYKNVPEEQKNQLIKFRSTHPYKYLTTDTCWNYISCGKGEKTLLLLPGSWHVADIWFQNIIDLEREYKVISPTYPGVTTMVELVKGVAGMLESENIQKSNILRHSFGGMIAQCFIRKYSKKVEKLILSNTDFPHAPQKRKMKIRVSYLLSERLFLSTLKRTYIKLIEPLKLEESEFWKAYFDELYSFRIKKQQFIGFLKCAFDFHKNYSFAPKDLKEWQGKILLLESDNDQYFPESQRKAIKALYPQAKVHTFHNGGHTPSIARRDEFNSIIKNFLKEDRV